MSSLRELLNDGTRELQEAGISDASIDSWLLLEYVFHITRAWYFANSRNEADFRKACSYRELISRRKEHIPLQHLTHQAFFMGREFYVDDRVLVPRQDTEILVQEVIRHLKPGMRILDLCTGSGCILFSLLLAVPGCGGLGTDLSQAALQVAKRNREKLGISPEEGRLLESDLFERFSEEEKNGFDVLVSNPPYIPTGEIPQLEEEVKDHDPMLALDGREDGLWFYRRITEKAGDYLRRGGWLFYEIGYNQGRAVSECLEHAGYRKIQVIRDLAGLDRVVCGQWEK